MVKTDKGFYDRKIVYLDYLERGEKVKNGGFVKWEAKGETSRIQIHIRGLYPTDTLRGEIQLISRRNVYTADSVKIDYGAGEYVATWKNEDLAGTAVSYAECDGVQVRLSENRLLIGRWREREAVQENPPESIAIIPDVRAETVDRHDAAEENTASEEQSVEAAEMTEEAEAVSQYVPEELEKPAESSDVTEQSGGEPEEPAGSGNMAEQEGEEPEESAGSGNVAEQRGEEPEESAGSGDVAEQRGGEPEELSESSDVAEREEEKEEESVGSSEIVRQEREEEPRISVRSAAAELVREGVEEPVESGSVAKQREEEPQMPAKTEARAQLSGDKWEQLNRQYPHIHPFGDSREYLSITPRDFVILSRKYQELVQNSFLLHGYYNYGHVILTKIREKEGERFYLGVPGVYYTREKQAALMFGFEGFEAGTEQAVDGGFGYYMKQVDI